MRLFYQSKLNLLKYRYNSLLRPYNEVYIGYVGRNNFGDDLLLDIYKYIRSGNISAFLDLPDFFLSKRHEHVVLGGGTIINGDIYYDALAKLNIKPRLTFCSGVIGSELKPEWRELLKDTTIYTRSKESAEVCRTSGLNAEALVDPGIYSSYVYNVDIPHCVKNYIVIAPHGLFPFYDKYDRLLSDIIQSKKLLKIFLFASSPEDLRLCERLKSQYPNSKIIKGWYDISASVNLIANSKLVVSTRLHPAVVAASFGVEFFVYKYNKKQEEFLNSIDATDSFQKDFNIKRLLACMNNEEGGCVLNQERRRKLFSLPNILRFDDFKKLFVE